jgi:hypothetical protein
MTATVFCLLGGRSAVAGDTKAIAISIGMARVKKDVINVDVKPRLDFIDLEVEEP